MAQFLSSSGQSAHFRKPRTVITSEEERRDRRRKMCREAQRRHRQRLRMIREGRSLSHPSNEGRGGLPLSWRVYQAMPEESRNRTNLHAKATIYVIDSNAKATVEISLLNLLLFALSFSFKTREQSPTTELSVQGRMQDSRIGGRGREQGCGVLKWVKKRP